MSDKPTDSTDSGTETSDAATENVACDEASVVSEGDKHQGSLTFLSRFWAFVTHPFLLNVGMFLIPLAFAMWCTYPVWSHDHLQRFLFGCGELFCR